MVNCYNIWFFVTQLAFRPYLFCKIIFFMVVYGFFNHVIDCAAYIQVCVYEDTNVVVLCRFKAISRTQFVWFYFHFLILISIFEDQNLFIYLSLWFFSEMGFFKEDRYPTCLQVDLILISVKLLIHSVFFSNISFYSFILCFFFVQDQCLLIDWKHEFLMQEVNRDNTFKDIPGHGDS